MDELETLWWTYWSWKSQSCWQWNREGRRIKKCVANFLPSCMTTSAEMASSKPSLRKWVTFWWVRQTVVFSVCRWVNHVQIPEMSPLSFPSPFPPSRMQSQTKMMNSNSRFWQWFRGRQSRRWRPYKMISFCPAVHFILCSIRLLLHCVTVLAGCSRSPKHRTSAGVSLLPVVKRSPSLIRKFIGLVHMNVSLHVWEKSVTYTSRRKNYQRNVCSLLLSFLKRLHTTPLITSESKSLLTFLLLLYACNE